MIDGPGDGRDGRRSVLVCDDHAVVRRGLALLLEAEPDIDVVGQAADGAEAVEMCRALSPDVVLLDVRMPGMGGIEAARRIAVEAGSTRVVMLTVSDVETDLYDAIRAGVAGYLLKDASTEAVADAVRAVAAGQSLIDPSMAPKLLSEFSALARRVDEVGASDAGPRLTAREVEVLGHVARGRSNREIAGELFIAENTVKNHVRNVLEKLQCRTRTEAVLRAVREQIIEA